LNSPAYRARLANPTDWSKKTMTRFKNMIRAVARITSSRGQGRGAVLGIVRLRPQAGHETSLRATLTERLDPAGLDGIISMHLLESDPALSGPTPEIPAAAGAASGDWFILIDEPLLMRLRLGLRAALPVRRHPIRRCRFRQAFMT